MIEREFIKLLKNMPLHDGARGLNDDAAVISIGDTNIIITKDMMVQGVHYFADADPRDVAWKLLAVNLSDLAAKGADPIGVMLGYSLSNVSGNDDWDRSFASGFQDALCHYGVKLLGGDTISSPLRTLSLTAIGYSKQHIPARGNAKSGDILYLSGPIGDACAGYDMINSADYDPNHICVKAFNRPIAQIDLGKKLAPIVHAMMDVSDGLLMDAQRMAKASNIGVSIALDTIPLSDEYCAYVGSDENARLKASSWGDDYMLLFSAAPNVKLPSNMIAIGAFTEGQDVHLQYRGKMVKLPHTLGYEHLDETF